MTRAFAVSVMLALAALLPRAARAQAVFVHETDADNTRGDTTFLNDPGIADRPELLLFATQVVGAYNPHPIAVSFLSRRNHWVLQNTDDAPLPPQTRFNVLAVEPGTPGAFTHEATPGNVRRSWTTLDHPAANGNPRAVLLVTARAGGPAAHPLGVWYAGDRWTIFNQDDAPMEPGAAFNVLVAAPAILGAEAGVVALAPRNLRHPAGPHVARTDFTRHDDVVFLTQNWGSRGPYNPHFEGLWDDSRTWTVLNEDQQPLPLGALFNTLVFHRGGATFAFARPRPALAPRFELPPENLRQPSYPAPTYPQPADVPPNEPVPFDPRPAMAREPVSPQLAYPRSAEPPAYPSPDPRPAMAPAIVGAPTPIGGPLRSLRSERKVSLLVTNASKAPVELIWLDFQGIERSYGTLGPALRQTLATFETHVWRFRQGPADVGTFTATAAPEQSFDIPAAAPAPPPPPRWTSADGGLPAGAFVGGDENGRPLYVCRAFHDGAWHPGKLIGRSCHIGFGGREVEENRFSVLADVTGTWTTLAGGVPSGAFVGGVERGQPLYVCRGRYGAGTHPGKVVDGRCNIGYGGSEVALSAFEVLVAPPALDDRR